MPALRLYQPYFSMVPVDGDHPRAEDHQLRDLALRRALRDENDRLEPHARGAAGAGGGGVPRGGAGDGIVSELDGLGHRHARRAILERRRRVQPVVLDVERLHAQLAPERKRLVQRRPADAQKARHVHRVGNGHQRAVAPHAVVTAGGQALAREVAGDFIIIVENVQYALFPAMRAGHPFRLERKFPAADRAAISGNASHGGILPTQHKKMCLYHSSFWGSCTVGFLCSK